MEPTWDYCGFDEIENEIPDEYVWERLRIKRNKLLNESDFRMVSDAPWEKQPWIEYRETLRQLPKTIKNPREAQWPETPSV